MFVGWGQVACPDEGDCIINSQNGGIHSYAFNEISFTLKGFLVQGRERTPPYKILFVVKWIGGRVK
jgi:hypothetical protein